MKINNVIVGFLLWTLFSSVPILYLFGYIELPTEINIWSEQPELTSFSVITLFLTSCSFVIQAVFIVFDLINGDIKFEFHINPFKPIQQYFVQKKKLNERKSELYDALFYAKTGGEIDLINKKLESLE